MYVTVTVSFLAWVRTLGDGIQHAVSFLKDPACRGAHDRPRDIGFELGVGLPFGGHSDRCAIWLCRLCRRAIRLRLLLSLLLAYDVTRQL